jgi:enoyl-CoA hydratase
VSVHSELQESSINEVLDEVSAPGLVVSQQGAVLQIEIDRPDKRNAIDQHVADGLNKAMDYLDEHEEVLAAVITGRGNSFCSGMDLKAFAEHGMPTSPRGPFGTGLVPATKPVIAAVEGWALAGGFELALSCDLIVSAESAQFGLPEVRHGLIAAGGGAFRLPRTIPYHTAAEILFTADPMPASRLHTLGVVNRLVEDGTALEEAMILAERISQNNPVAVQASKMVAMRSIGWVGDEAWHTQEPEATIALESAAAKEGAQAFVKN